MNYGFIIDNRKCIGCHACTVACKQEHDVPIGVNRTWVKYIEKGVFPNTRRVFSVQRCNHCSDAPCVEICPVSALWKRKDGIVDFDGNRCIGCKACMQACPYDAIYLHPDTNTAAKCNYCAHRIEVGLAPPCVNVCPEHAIIAGDMNDPTTEIATMLARYQVQVRKAEKNTGPNVFYIDGDEASLNPTYSSTPEGYLWSEIPQRVYQIAPPRLDQAEVEATRVYDQGQSHTDSWGWKVAAYLCTKSVAAGIPLVVLGSGLISQRIYFSLLEIVTAIVFLTLTTILLVADLKHPERFHWIVFRPQWRSWLTRGAFILMGYAGLLGLDLLNHLQPWSSWSPILFALTILFAIGSAVYSAFLFWQAKGRDFWQSPLFAPHLLVMALLAGSAVLIMLDDTIPALSTILFVSLILHAILIASDLLVIHGTRDGKLAAHTLTGSRWTFWLGAIVIGIFVPLLMLRVQSLGPAGLLAIVGLYLYERIWVRAGQSVPLS